MGLKHFVLREKMRDFYAFDFQTLRGDFSQPHSLTMVWQNSWKVWDILSDCDSIIGKYGMFGFSNYGININQEIKQVDRTLASFKVLNLQELNWIEILRPIIHLSDLRQKVECPPWGYF